MLQTAAIKFLEDLAKVTLGDSLPVCGCFHFVLSRLFILGQCLQERRSAAISVSSDLAQLFQVTDRQLKCLIGAHLCRLCLLERVASPPERHNMSYETAREVQLNSSDQEGGSVPSKDAWEWVCNFLLMYTQTYLKPTSKCMCASDWLCTSKHKHQHRVSTMFKAQPWAILCVLHLKQ